jgi:hypothetical protein
MPTPTTPANRTTLRRRLLANKIAMQIALDVATGRDLDEALEDAAEEGLRLEREGADEATWVDGWELYDAYLRVCPPPVEGLDPRDIPPPY